MKHWYSGEYEKLNYGIVEELIDDGDNSILVKCSNFGTLSIVCFDFVPKIGDSVELFVNGPEWVVKLQKIS